MSVLDLALTMEALKAKLVTGGQKRVYADPGESVVAPCVVVGYPTVMEFDATYGDGARRFVFPVYAVAGAVTAKATRKALSGYVAGAVAIKAALDGSLSVSPGTATVRVTDATVQAVILGAVEQIAVRFDVEVFG